MTTDRELLEAAARAAGIELRWFSHLRRDGVDLEPKTPHIGNVEWRPLTDDGDALRLAVKLRIYWYIGHGIIRCGDEHGAHAFAEALSDDPAAALRRCIVRAAAAMAGDA